MLNPVLRHGRIAVLAYGIGLAGMFVALSGERAFALTPTSPEVKAAIDKGIAFLKSDAATDSFDRVGARALQGYALLSNEVERTHPKIIAAAARIETALGGRDPAKFDVATWDIYSTGLAIIFLVELDPKKYHADIECLLSYLRSRQKPHGGWGYPEKTTGDTSMTQYGVLSSWKAKRAGFSIPIESIEKVTTWLLKTQDPSGAFGYQGNVAEGAGLVPQQEIRPSMTAAASGSLYVCASILGLTQAKKQEEEEKLPTALKEIKKKEKEPAKERVKSRIDPRLVHDTEERAKKWMDAHPKVKDVEMWVHYYLYALERCMSFRSLYEQTDEKEPEWYNDGAEFLMKTQISNGSWSGQCGAVPDTAFSLLFLMRNTRKVIGKITTYNAGTMIGGRGIPPNLDQIELRNGNIVARPMLGPAERLLAALDDASVSREFDNSANLFADLPSDKVEELANKYGDKIRRLVSSKSPEARLAAVQLLARTRDLDNVETLIFALTDPDYRVVRAANDGLLRIRRIPTVVALPDTLSEEDRRLLVEKWKAWYQTIRPSAEVKY
ncbi:MAG: prenyltransferase/squalene oxidase repeat-containing protein [Thermoguttaceae bacterium]|jgi:hypothetical protein